MAGKALPPRPAALALAAINPLLAIIPFVDPGDIRIETESGGFYFPLMTCLIISVVLSLVLWLIRR